ncbi:MAG: sugar kinase [Firmicutes bacterium]|nr:sugar kinase [Bacillota bacterium]
MKKSKVITPRILTIGEPLVVNPGSLQVIGGAELNVAKNLVDLGNHAEYVTKLGNDENNDAIWEFLLNNNIGIQYVQTISTHPTGYMTKAENAKGGMGIKYFRKGSAASTIDPNYVDDINLEQYDALHLTGIFPSLSDDTYEATKHLMNKANFYRLLTTFDSNLRLGGDGNPLIYRSTEEMIRKTNELAFMSDVFMPGLKEARTLTGLHDEDDIANFYLYGGAKNIVLKRGGMDGAYAISESNREIVNSFGVPYVIDKVGAGDACAAGTIDGLLRGLSLAESAERGCAASAMQLMSRADNGGIKSQRHLEEFMIESRQKQASGEWTK